MNNLRLMFLTQSIPTLDVTFHIFYDTFGLFHIPTTQWFSNITAEKRIQFVHCFTYNEHDGFEFVFEIVRRKLVGNTRFATVISSRHLPRALSSVLVEIRSSETLML